MIGHSLPALALLALAGSAGALVRYLLDVTITARQQRPSREGARRFPWGILAANTLACFTMAAATSWALRSGVRLGLDAAPQQPALFLLAITVGFCGSLSTMSTFMVATVSLVRSGDRQHAFAYVAATLAAGLLAAGLGHLVATLLPW